MLDLVSLLSASHYRNKFVVVVVMLFHIDFADFFIYFFNIKCLHIKIVQGV